MKKRLSWAILALMLVFTSIGPISAAEANPDPDGEWIFLSDDQVSMIIPGNTVANEDTSLNEDIPMPAAYVPVRGVVYSMTVSPIAFAIIDGEEGFVQRDDISATRQYTTYYQNAVMSLSKSETQQLMGRLRAACEADTDAYILVGWLLKVTFIFQAPTPQSFVWKATGTDLEPSDSSTLSLKGHGTGVQATCSYGFAFPQGIDGYTENYEITIGGRYNFKNQAGTALAMDVSGTCSLNS